jgi:peptidoglycan/xylan/chitin deacetylase (PgdA/CDA1 family)
MALGGSDLRWYAKKLARAGTVLGSLPFVRPGHMNGGARVPRIRVLTYHRFGEVARDPFCVARADFDKQIKYIADNGLAVSLADLSKALSSADAGIPPSAVLVTIDDGHQSTFTHALPVLRHYQVPAVSFVTASLVGAGRDRPLPAGAPEPYMTWPELSALGDAGIAVGSHAYTHRSLGRLPLAAAAEEATQSREMLERELANPITSFAYPYGTKADFNNDTQTVLRQAGYSLAFTSQHGAIHAGLDPLALPRIKIEAGDRDWMFPLILRGGLDAWRLVDNTLWRIQAAH